MLDPRHKAFVTGGVFDLLILVILVFRSNRQSRLADGRSRTMAWEMTAPEGSWTVPERIHEEDDDWESSEPGGAAGESGAWKVCAPATAMRNAPARNAMESFWRKTIGAVARRS